MADQQEKVLQTIAAPDLVQTGDADTLIAIRHFLYTSLTEKFCAVIYKEVTPWDGFVITAYFTSVPSPGRRAIWRR